MKKILIAAVFSLIAFAAFAQDEIDTMQYGYKITKWESSPRVGAYIIGTYKYSSEEGKNGGEGFNARIIRAYVDGSIFKQFNYRLQVQWNGSGDNQTHIRDFYIEWAKWAEFKVKIGQFKRAFTFENPYNPWDVGNGDYAQATKMLAGLGTDRCGQGGTGGRDQGLQIQGDLFPVGSDNHRLVHYQLAVYNGNGINKADNNAQKDLIGTIQFQPIKDLYIGAFGWKGNWNNGTVTVDRNRWAVGAKYEHNNWSARAEYVKSYGYKASEVNADGTVKDSFKDTATGRADAFYATVGVPCTDWFKVYVVYDQYREQATDDTKNTIISLAPNFRLHKNLNLQLVYRYNMNNITTHKFSEVWLETYIRF